MASSSFPSINHNGGSVEQDEVEQWAHPISRDGLVGTPADQPLVYADSSGRQVKWRADRFGHVRGRVWASGSSDITTEIAANSSGQTRIDTAVLRLTRSGVDPEETWLVTEGVVQGTPGAGPPALTLDTGTTGKFELPVADITVANGASNLAPGTVTARAWYLGETCILCTSDTRPSGAFLTDGLLFHERNTGRTYHVVGSTPRRLTDEAEAGLGMIFGRRFIGADPYPNGSAEAAIATKTVTLVNGHTYEHVFCADVATGSALTPIDVEITLKQGNTAIDYDRVRLEFTNDRRRARIVAPYIATASGNRTFTVTAKRISGGGGFVVRARDDSPLWWRVVDLGTQTVEASN